MNYNLIGILLGVGLLIALLTDIHTNRVLARQKARSKATNEQLASLIEKFMADLEDLQINLEISLEELDKLNSQRKNETKTKN